MAKADQSRAGEPEPRVPRASAGRLSLYLRFLEGMVRDGTAKVSSGQLGEAVGITDAQVRKDLAHLGNLGQPGIGYQAQQLIETIRQTLGIDRQWSVAVVGVGNLARALLRYRGFREQGFRIVALFDADPHKIGQSAEGLPIHSTADLNAVVAATEAELAILAVPAEAAQAMATALISAGVRGILNFTPAVVRVPPKVSLVSVDLSVQMEQLAFLVQMNRGESAEGGVGERAV